MSLDLYVTLQNGIELANGLEVYLRENDIIAENQTDFYLDSFYSVGSYIHTTYSTRIDGEEIKEEYTIDEELFYSLAEE